MFQETLIRAESQYRMARAQEAAGRTRRRRFSGGRDATPTSGAPAHTPNDISRLVPPATAESVPSTIDDATDVREREPAAV
jgi:hypothetical protein